MRLISILLVGLMVSPASAGTYYVTNGLGSVWSVSTNWTPNGVPDNGDTVRIDHTMHLDVSKSIGDGSSTSQAGTGTVYMASQVLHGIGTAFTTQLHLGDIVCPTGANRCKFLTSITNDTTAGYSDGNGITACSVGSPCAFTFNHMGIFVSSLKAFTVDAGATLTLKNDAAVAGGSWNQSAGSGLTFDTTSVAETFHIGADANIGGAGTLLNFAGSSGSHVTVSKTGSNLASFRTQQVGGSTDAWDINVTYNDWSDIGDASNDAFEAPCGAGKRWNFDNITLTRIGNISTGPAIATSNSCNLTVNKFEVKEPPTAAAGLPYTQLQMIDGGGTLTGTRSITNSVIGSPTSGPYLFFSNNGIKGYTITGNYFDRVAESTSSYYTSATQLFAGNIFVRRRMSTDGSTNWTFLCAGNCQITNNYYVNEEGPNSNNDHELMPNDGTTVTGTWRYDHSIYERSGPQTGGFHCAHAQGNGASAVQVFQIDHFMVLPEGNGDASCTFAARGNPNGPHSLFHNSLMQKGYLTGQSGGMQLGCCGDGATAVTVGARDNLFWSKAVGSVSGDGYGLRYVGTAADVLIAAGTKNNAHYNGRSGQLYDNAGANGTTVFGYDGFRQTNKTTTALGANDVNLGSGSSEGTQGPMFIDPTRAFATFDSAYLGHTATAWDGASHVYSIGDTVSAATTGWYGGATVNYRCVKAHTSASGNSTNGKPGDYTVVTSYRTNWEFASAYSIRQAVIAHTLYIDGALGIVSSAGMTVAISCSQASPCDIIGALTNWVRRGGTPQNPALRLAGSDGADIGPVPMDVIHVPVIVQ